MNTRNFNVWREQRKLNRVMNPSGVNPNKRNVYNYTLALLAEINEHQECYLWKHWSAEAKAGRRWECLDPQNAKVEAIDILFFLISLLQSQGITEDKFYKAWDRFWAEKAPKYSRDFPVRTALDIVGFSKYQDKVHKMVQLLKYYFKTEDGAMDVYKQKLSINYARMQRGRKQVGDKLSEKENQSIH